MMGVSENLLLLLAQLVNGTCHVISVFFVFNTSFLIWNNRNAPIVSAIFYALYPVAIYFAGDAFDITFASTLFLAALWCLVKYITIEQPNPRSFQFTLIFASSILIGLATLARPHFLTLVTLLPIVILFKEHISTRMLQTVLIATLGLTITFGIMGAINLRHSGEFRILPWQGAYNLWAANKSDANGRFFEQSMAILSYDESANPARIESETLYLRETQTTEPININVANQYWRTKAIQYVTRHPVRWSQLMLKKALFFTHNQEQYNNKTYQFHKDRSKWLSRNPLGWGVLVCLGFVGILMVPRRFVILFLATIAIYGCGVLLFYASARFRLPIAPVLAVLAGGSVVFAQKFPRYTTQKKLLVAVSSLAIGGYLFYPFNLVNTTATYAQDYILLGRASFKLNQYGSAKKYFENAYQLRPGSLSTRNLLCSNEFNRLFSNTQYTITKNELSNTITHCASAVKISNQAKLFEGYFRWLDGQTTDAKNIWESIILADESEKLRAHGMMLFSDIDSAYTEYLLSSKNVENIDTFGLFALAHSGHKEATAELMNRLGKNQFKQHDKLYSGLFHADRINHN